MSHYKDATYCTYYTGTSAAESSPCEVRFTKDGEVVVSYETEDGYSVYKGEENGEGHYLLECDEPDGRASLHRFPDSLILEGFWEEDGSKGMWRIELGEVADEVTGERVEDANDEKFEEETIKIPNADVAAAAEEDDDDEEWVSIPRHYRFPLRDDWIVHLRLPDDITRREGKRLARFVKSIPSGF